MGYQAVLRALADLEMDEQILEAIGVRLIRISMPWPMAESELRELTAGLYTVLVVEDKLPFVGVAAQGGALPRSQPTDRAW